MSQILLILPQRGTKSWEVLAQDLAALLAAIPDRSVAGLAVGAGLAVLSVGTPTR
jgi:hypothetical protein